MNALKDGGFVIELSNEWGVTKNPCDYMRLNVTSGTAMVTLHVLKAASSATEWVTGASVSAGPVQAGSLLTVAVPAGNTSFVHFEAA